MKTARIVEVIPAHKRYASSTGRAVVKGDAAIVDVDTHVDGYGRIFVSESTVLGRPETFAFGVGDDGQLVNYDELSISVGGRISWRGLLESNGYAIEEGGQS